MPYEIAIVNPRKVSKKKRSRSVASVVRAAASIKSKPKGKSMAKKKRSKKGKLPAGLKRYMAAKKKAAKKVTRRRKSVVKTARRRRGSNLPKRPAQGYVQGSAPIRRRKLNPRRKHRRHRKHHAKRHHNPRLLAGFTGQLMNGAIGAAGALGVNVVLGFLPLPANLKTGMVGKAVKLVGAAGVGMLAGRFMGAARGQAIAQGAITVALYDVFSGFLKQAAPTIPLLAGDDEFGYLDPATVISGDEEIGAFLPAGVSGDEEMGAYLSGEEDMGEYENMGAYLSGDEDVINGYDF